MNIEGLDYNTQRAKLILPEYGREIQQMVDHCLTLPIVKSASAVQRPLLQSWTVCSLRTEG